MIRHRFAPLLMIAALAGTGVVQAVHAAAPAPAADPSKVRDAIKTQKYEVQRVPYRDEGRDDPFMPKVPLQTVQSRDRWKVRIGGLRLSTVVSGRNRVALFTELSGLSYAYMLVNTVLLGPDHRAIPGIAGSIEPLGNSGNFKVTLRQGTEKVEHTFIKMDEGMRRRASELRARQDHERESRGGSRSVPKTGKRNSTGGGDQ